MCGYSKESQYHPVFLVSRTITYKSCSRASVCADFCGVSQSLWCYWSRLFDLKASAVSTIIGIPTVIKHVSVHMLVFAICVCGQAKYFRWNQLRLLVPYAPVKLDYLDIWDSPIYWPYLGLFPKYSLKSGIHKLNYSMFFSCCIQFVLAYWY